MQLGVIVVILLLLISVTLVAKAPAKRVENYEFLINAILINDKMREQMKKVDISTQNIKALVKAVIHTESSGRPDAISPVGAAGLMQIMPLTGSWLAGKAGYGEYSLYDPYDNIWLGMYYLIDIIALWDGSVERGLAGYNAGPANAIKALTEYPETRDYVKKVMERWDKYGRK